MRDVLGKMRECGKYIKMRDFPHDCGMVDTYVMGRSRLPLAPNGDDSAVDLAERFSAASVPSHPPLLADNDECSVAEPLYVFQPATVEAISKLSMAASSKVCPRIDVLTAVLLNPT